MAHRIHVRLSSVFLAILLSIVTIVTRAEEDQSCPHYGLSFRRRCFWFVDIKTTWYEALHLCHRLYGDGVTLVTIKDRETNDFVQNQWERSFWIGLHEAHGETIWRWVDNTEPANGNFQNWESGTPPPARTGNRNCGLIHYDGDSWRDYDCTSRFFSVCAELTSAPMCPHGGIFFRDRCYWRGTRDLSWKAADQACQDDFGPETRLAVARDAETNLFLSRLAGCNIWLGLSDRTEEGVWEWIDGAPFEYQNWAISEPSNNNGNENCAVLRYPAAKWGDLQCGDPVSESDPVTMSAQYICAIPPCYETTEDEGDELVTVSNQEVLLIDHSICARTECTQHCVNGGACHSTGQCICIKQFPGMTCNLDEWEVEMENELVNTTAGSTLTLKCKVNLPVDHISSLTWTKCEPGFLPLYRHTVMDSLSQGYSILEISDVTLADAGQYHCKVVLSFTNTTLPVARKALVTVIEGSTHIPTTKPTTERITTEESRTSQPVSATTTVIERTTTREASTPFSTTKPTTGRITLKETQTSVTAMKRINTEGITTRGFEEQPVSPSERTAGKTTTKQEERTKKEIKHESEQHSNSRPAGDTSALTVILFIMTTLLLVAVVVLMIKMKRMERRSLEGSGLIELQDKF